jgi:hypothetical protein
MNKVLSWAYKVLAEIQQPPLGIEIFRKVPWSIVYKIITKNKIYYLKVSHATYSIEAKILGFFQQHNFKHTPKIISYNPKLNSILVENAGQNFHQIYNTIYQHHLYKKVINHSSYAQSQINYSCFLTPA